MTALAVTLTIDELRALMREAVLDAIGSSVSAESDALFVRVASYAQRVSLSERSIWNLVARGLPCIGEGRGRRVDVLAADAWLRTRRDVVIDASERDARRRARAAAKGKR